jgi:hypothetical protein
MHTALILKLALLVSVQTPPAPAPAASAQSNQAEVERLFAEGASLYKAGKYRPAIDKFEEAYALFPEPNLIYNIARAYEALGDVDQAIMKYRLCSTHPRGTDDLKAKATSKLAVLSAAKASGAAAPNPSPPSATGSDAPPPSTPSPEPGAAVVAAPPPSGLPIWGIAGGTAAGIGALVGVGGGVLFAVGGATHDQLQSDLDAVSADGVSSLTRAQADAASADGTNQKTIGVALLATGGVLLAGSIPLFAVQLMGGE